MKRKTSYKIIASIVTLGLLLQSFPFGLGINTLEPAMAETLFSTETRVTATHQAASAILPAALTNPLSISRVQSSYQAGESVVITYTVTNNQPVSLTPQIPETEDVVELAQVLANFDATADPNTILDVIVVNDLGGAGSYVSATEPPDRQGESFIWKLGAIPPGAERSFSVTLTGPGATADFTTLDSGAVAYGALQGRMVSAHSAPALLAPDGFAQWLIWTPDADIYDTRMLAQVATTGADPQSMFDYVRYLEFEAYSGSLRGTRGTLWSAAGNAVDQASLLIAMLRAYGIPARYRHGTLSVSQAQQLILSMFPTPTQILGHVPPGTEVSDPANDPTLIAEARDHWWVEAYLPGSGWTDLDPSFTTAEIGQSFAAPAGDGTDRIAELPDSLRHKVHLSLKVEQYYTFPIGGPNLQYLYPLEASFNAVELAGQPINIAFDVATENQGGLVYGNIIHTYAPVLSLGMEEIGLVGDTFSELLTNFPLASYYATGMWITVRIETPDGTTSTYEREIKDRIGPAARLYGGNIELPPLGEELFISIADIIQLQVKPQSRGSWDEVARIAGRINELTAAAGAAFIDLDSLDVTDLLATALWVDAHARTLQAVDLATLERLGTTFYALASDIGQTIAEGQLVKSYPDAPKLLLMSQAAQEDTRTLSFELLNIRERAIAYPGQVNGAAIAANFARTITDKGIELDLMGQLGADQTHSALRTFNAALENDISLVMVTSNSLDDLAALPISDEAKARITQAIMADLLVFVPAESVMIEGEALISWLEIDDTGHAAYVNEQGHRAAAAVYAKMIKSLAMSAGSGGAAAGGAIGTILWFIANIYDIPLTPPNVRSIFTKYIGDIVSKSLEKLGYAMRVALLDAAMNMMMVCRAVGGGFALHCAGGVLATVLNLMPFLFLLDPQSTDPPLPSALFQRLQEVDSQVSATAILPIAASHSATTLEVAAETSHTRLMGDAQWAWNDANARGVTLSGLTATQVELYAGDETLNWGTLTVDQAAWVAVDDTMLALEVGTTGSHTFFAPAVTGLAAGAARDSYSATLTAAQPFALTLHDAIVRMNGNQLYSGDLTAVVHGTADLSGPGLPPLPQFLPGATVQMQNGKVNLGPLEGTVLAGGAPLAAPNGLAVANYSGTINVNQSSPARDAATFSGTASFFTLALSSSASAINPTQSASITPIIASNFTDDFSLTAEAPSGWKVDIEAGQIQARPPTGAPPADYILLVTVRSEMYPRLFVSALHTITVTPYAGVEMSVDEDLLITIPMGPVLNDQADIPGTHGHIVDGRAEVPGAAYTISLTNTSTSAHTFGIAVSGLPVGWTILSNAGQSTQTSLTLPAGAVGQIGLYISPTVSSLLPAGSSHVVNVTATAQSDPGLSASDAFAFTMPEVAFPYPEMTPSHQFVVPGDPISFDLTLTNVGNVAGSFPVALEMPTSAYNSTPLSPTMLSSPQNWTTAVLQPYQSETTTIHLTTEQAIPGRIYHFRALSSVGEYQPAAVGAFTTVSENAGPIFAGAQQIAETCPLNEPALSAALNALALAVTDLEVACEGGACPLPLRDQAVAAAQTAAAYARHASPLVRTHTDLEAAAAALAVAADDGDILAALPDLATAVSGLTTEVCAISQHRPTLRLQPWMGAALPDQTANYDLQLSNRGTVTTTYAITLTLPQTTLALTRTVPPGATEPVVVPAFASALGLHLIEAEAVALDAFIDYIGARAEARLNVVDRFIQVTAVRADPPFVETGVSSATLQVEIANVAGIGQSAIAQAEILTPGGASQWSGAASLAILGGAPRTYDLATVDTSGWASGVYTIMVDVQLDAIAEGSSGYGYLNVDQAIGASHAVIPEGVAPGTVTVTTVITTEILQYGTLEEEATLSEEIASRRYTLYNAPYWNVERDLGLSPAQEESASEEEVEAPLTFTHPSEATESETPYAEDVRFSQAGFAQLQTTFDGFTRIEQDSDVITTTGSWTNLSHSRASGGSYWRSATADSTAELTFDGDWLNVGFIGTHFGGYVEININGDSQGIFDLYRREDNTPISFVFAGLGTGPHTVILTIIGDSNPFSLGTRVQLDYIDYWDGTPLGNGLFEEDDVRVLRSGGWTDVTYVNASGGSYMRGSSVTAWFPFDGDSFTYHALAYNGARYAQLFVDSQYIDTVNLYHPNSIGNAITRTFSYDGFGPGPHILQIQSYRDQTTVDALQTPGVAPFIDPNPAPGSINRYEEDHPAIRYNGVPYTQTAQSWSRWNAATASDGQYLRSNTANDTIGFDFEGSWLNLGFYADRFSGYAEIFIDGDSQGVVDLYRREDKLISFFFPDLTPGSHTVTVTVLGSGNPFVTFNRVQFDYVDFGDGTGLDHGAFEEDAGRILRAGSWITENNANASGGSFIRSGGGSAWFYFEGDSFTYQGMAYNLANRTRLYVNGQYLDTVDLYHPNSLTNAITRTFSYEGFGPGPHLLQINAYRGQATLDAITTPGIGPFIDPNPPVTGITRFEEDHPAIRYNSVPFTQTHFSWSRVDNINSNRASDGQYIHSSTTGDTISFDFEGSWIGVGFATNRFSGQAEIAIDGNVMAVVDLYTREDDTESFYFSDLGEGSHTITITVLGTQHPNASNSQIYLDYFDVWDGQPLAEGHFEETDERIFYSGGWSRTLNVGASGGAYAASGASDSTAWFPFTGDSVTFQTWAASYHSVEIKIDGVSQGHFNTYRFEAGPRSFSFAGLGDGPHVLEVRKYRGNATIDAFITPSTGEHYEIPAPNGVIRLEEDHPALRYNGYPYPTMPQSWATQSSLNQSSGGYNASTGTAGNTLSLEFEGTWVGVGFISGGIVEIFINGQSQGTFDTAVDSANGGISSIYFDDLITGTHTISITAISGSFRPDFIDIWDGQPLEKGWYNATLDDYSGRFHYSSKVWWGQYQEHYAHEGDYVQQSLINANPNFWFTFVGNDLTLLSRNRNNAILQITIDGQYRGEYNMTAEFSNQPYALHFPNLGDGPHVVQIHTRNFGIIDAFEVNPEDFYSYTPQIIWHDNSATEELDPNFQTAS